jgi:hypothetical protein
MSSLEARLAALEDERAVLEVLHRYGRAIDDGLENEFLDCWTSGATLCWQSSPHRLQPHFVDRRFEGREAIRGAFRAHTHAPDFFHKHILYAPLIQVIGDRATVQSTFERHDESPDGPIIRSFGRYVDEMQRCDDGRWRFTSRISLVENSVTWPAAQADAGASASNQGTTGA